MINLSDTSTIVKYSTDILAYLTTFSQFYVYCNVECVIWKRVVMKRSVTILKHYTKERSKTMKNLVRTDGCLVALSWYDLTVLDPKCILK
jgi:hypothetical protein